MDLRNSITHEVGHLIGLDHPPNTPRNAESTMFASAPACETKKRSLAQDDIDGICMIYPSGMPNQQCYPPDGPAFKLVENNDGYSGCSAVSVESLSIGYLVPLGFLAFLTRRRTFRAEHQRPRIIPT